MEDRKSFASEMATSKGWVAETIETGTLPLFSYRPLNAAPSDTLTVYIEGDGLAWISATQVSTDPTPRNPLALRLALAQPYGNAAYLARPCQYVDAAALDCPSRYWTEQRFAPEVIDASNAAIDQLKHAFKARRLTLVGYSGGAAVAALVAARRQDVELLVTVAGNLDPMAWTRYHRITPLTGSLSPLAEIEALGPIRQRHFVGGQDTNTRPKFVQGYADQFPAGSKPRVDVVREFGHECCWVERWPSLWQTINIQ